MEEVSITPPCPRHRAQEGATAVSAKAVALQSLCQACVPLLPGATQASVASQARFSLWEGDHMNNVEAAAKRGSRRSVRANAAHRHVPMTESLIFMWGACHPCRHRLPTLAAGSNRLRFHRLHSLSCGRRLKVLRLAVKDIRSCRPGGALLGAVAYADTFLEVGA